MWVISGCYGSFAAAFTGLLNALFTELFDAVLTELLLFLGAIFSELFDALLTEPLDALFTELLHTVFTEPLDALFTELFDAVLTELLYALFTELLDTVFTELLDAPFTEFLGATELFVDDDLAATALPRDPPLLTCFDLEEALAAATFGLLGVGDLAVFGLPRIRGAIVSTLAGLSTVVISGLCTSASDSPPLVDLNSDSPRALITSPPLQTLAPSSQSMPALPQSALVSGWLEVSIRSGSPHALMDGAARPDPATPSLGE